MKTITQDKRKSDYTVQLSVRIRYAGSIPHQVRPCPEGAFIETKHTSEWSFDEDKDSQIGTFADVSKWRDLPHVALANWQFDTPENLCRFIKLYGAPASLLMGEGPFVVRMSDMGKLQEILRAGWRATPVDFSVEALKLLDPLRNVHSIDPWGWGCQITVYDPWIYICFIFQNDYAKGNVGVCPNRDCPSRYFIKTRRDQQFCSHECRNHVNVQRWRSLPKNQKRERAARLKREGKT